MRGSPLGAVMLAASATLSMPVRASDWLQFGFDAAHSGYNRAETGYSTATGNRLAFAPVALPAPADIAPILVEGVAFAGGPRDVLFIVTTGGSLLALDAGSGATLWSRTPAAAGSQTTSSPAVDAARQFVYAYGLDGRVHKYTIADGSENFTDGWPQLVTLKPAVDKVAAALAIATTQASAYLYVVTDSFRDLGDFQGHLTAIDLATGAQKVFNAQCSVSSLHFVENGTSSGGNPDDCASIPSPAKSGQTANSGIWGRAGATYDAGSERVFVTTGNGLFDPTNAQGFGNDWGDSVLALNADGSGSTAVAGAPLDSYTPATYAELLENDADLGSASLAVLPAPAGSNIAHLGLQGGKDGCIRLLNLDLLSGVAGAGNIGGELQSTPLPNGADHCSDGGSNGGLKTQPAVWVDPDDGSTWAFIAHGGGAVAYRLGVDGDGNPALGGRWSTTTSGTSPVIANATLYHVSNGFVRALDARTGNTIWFDNRIGNIHWQSPIVVNGRLYVIDQTSKLWVYQLDGIFRDSL